MNKDNDHKHEPVRGAQSPGMAAAAPTTPESVVLVNRENGPHHAMEQRTKHTGPHKVGQVPIVRSSTDLAAAPVHGIIAPARTSMEAAAAAPVNAIVPPAKPADPLVKLIDPRPAPTPGVARSPPRPEIQHTFPLTLPSQHVGGHRRTLSDTPRVVYTGVGRAVSPKPKTPKEVNEMMNAMFTTVDLSARALDNISIMATPPLVDDRLQGSKPGEITALSKLGTSPRVFRRQGETQTAVQPAPKRSPEIRVQTSPTPATSRAPRAMHQAPASAFFSTQTKFL